MRSVSDWFDDNLGWILLAGLSGLIVVMFVSISETAKNDCRLLKECMNDGHKEYECVSMLRSHQSGSTIVPMPVVVR